MRRTLESVSIILIAVLLLDGSASAQVDATELELLPPLSETDSSEVTSDDILDEVPSYGAWWTKPAGWFSLPIWDFGTELGLNGSEGNTQSISMVTSAAAKRETDLSTLDLKLTYGKTESNGTETQHYALMDMRWDWNLSPHWIVYTKTMLEYDEFKVFDLRLTKTLGLGYHFIKNDRTALTSRFGAGASREFDGPEDEWVPEANFGGDLEHELSKRQKVKVTLDYYPAWETFSDYRLVTNAHWEILLDESTNLSLKVGAIHRYDSTPNGAKANDIDYFVTLLWKI